MAEENVMVYSLETENISHPIGLDIKNPRFSWKIESKRDCCFQSAYRIMVFDENDVTVWDTKKVLSDQQNEIIYDGVSLKSSSEYHWKVQIWDEKGIPTKFSENALFETGFLEASDWKGIWIGGNSNANPLEGVQWIGCNGNSGSKVNFTLTFYCNEPLQQAVFDGIGSADWELSCNERLCRKMNPEWKQSADVPIRYADLTEWVQKGKNVLEFRVTADETDKTAVIGKLVLRNIFGEERAFFTDEQWEAEINGRKRQVNVLGKYGIDPFGMPKRRGIAPLLRKEFFCEDEILRGRLFVCGLGYASCTINGKMVTDALLTTEYSQYDKRVYYRTFDVTHLIQKGNNCIGVELGRGYYSFFQDWIGKMPEQDEPKLLLQLMLWKTNGNCEIISSTDEWKTVDGPTVDDNIWYGEKYDARRCPKDWDLVGYDDSKWKNVSIMKAPGGKLSASMVQPIRITEELHPVAVTDISSKIRVYDFGKVVSGNAKIVVSEPRGMRIKLTYGETLLPNGRVDMESPNRVVQFWEPGQVDIYVSGGEKKECWSPKFSYKGYRYIEVEGVDHEISIVGEVFHNDLKSTGYFHCSNELFNEIHKIITPTILNNFHSIPTDTPAYEKRGWTGDAQSICDTALRNVDAQMFFEKWIQDLCDSQCEDGAIPDTCPGPCYYPPAPEWMCAIVMIPYQLYIQCGSKTILEKCYPQMKRYIEYETQRLQEGMSSNLFYGDWNSPVGSRPPEGTAYNATCFVYKTVEVMKEIAKILKKRTEEEKYTQIAFEIRNTLNVRFFDEREMLYHGDVLCGFRQTPTVLPLAFGIVPEDKKEAVAKSLARNIHEKDKDHLSTGCMGLKYLAPVLTEYGQAKTAYAIVNQKDFPSWGYWLENGATTCWEEWTTKTRSFDHFYFGTIDDWFFQYLAGIRPIEAGYHCFAIRPYLCGTLMEADCRIETIYGSIQVEWKLEKTEFYLRVSVPPNTKAYIYMQNGEEHIVGSGEYEFLEYVEE